MRKIILYLLLIIFISILAVFFLYLNPRLPVLNAYSAKRACSCYFVTNRTPESISEKELNNFPFSLTSVKYNDKEQYVEASFLGIQKSRVVFDNNLGCIQTQKGKDTLNFKKPTPSFLSESDTLLWPYGIRENDVEVTGVDYKKIEAALDYAFDVDNQWEKQTLSMVVIHKDTLIAERYANGLHKETPILGWSMTKSITNALIGILFKEGKLKLDDKNLFADWANDERSDIMLDNLLRMNSGLEWNEDYGDNSDATIMLFKETSAADYAKKAKAEHAPGDVFEYSSGTTNLLSALIKSKFDNTQDYFAFPYTKLFHPLKIYSAQIEPDASGTYVLSSFMHATTRDWGKLGLLYLNDGIWQNDTILSPKWVNYSFKETPGSQPSYGMQIWRNGDNPKFWPSAPEDTYYFGGYEGQWVIMIPSKDLVIVRMGLSKGPPFDLNGTIEKILAAL